jgi:hypothetical protein
MDTSKHMPQITLNSFNGLELSNPYVLGFWQNGHINKDWVNQTILFLLREATDEGTEKAHQTPESKLYDLNNISQHSPSLCIRYSNFKTKEFFLITVMLPCSLNSQVTLPLYIRAYRLSHICQKFENLECFIDSKMWINIEQYDTL